MNEQKLERCPFCGSKAHLVAREYDEGYEAIIYCTGGAEIGCFTKSRHWAAKKSWAIKSAKEAWNRRAPLLDNKALTVEELRGMDGEPVYIVCDPDADGEQLVMWALVEVDADGGEVYLTNNHGGRTEFLHPEDFDGMHIYRRPPEKEE